MELWSYAVAAEPSLCLNDFAFVLPADFVLHWRNTRSFCTKTTPWHCFWKTTTKPNPLIPLEKALLNGKQSCVHFHTHMTDSDLSYASVNWNTQYNIAKFALDLAQILEFPSVNKVAPCYVDRRVKDSRDNVHHITVKSMNWIRRHNFKRRFFFPYPFPLTERG